MKISSLMLAAALMPCLGSAQTDSLFDNKKLSGWWVESYDTSATCEAKNLHIKYDLVQGQNRLIVKFDRKQKTEVGEIDQITATILSSTSRTLIIQYDGETRKKQNGKLVEWELAIVAPGVYRWRETEWPLGEVNVVVGLKCSD